MATFESPVKVINASQEAIYNKFSNLNNLEGIKDKIPQDKVKDFQFDNDSCSFSVSPIGTLGIRVIEREPYKTIKFESEKSPIQFDLWIQIVKTGENESKIKLTIKAELSAFVKPLVSKPLQDALDKMADTMAMLPY
ncbi:MAG: SRPBCC family protein [Bacteroidales bacterium]|nr:SRPBCC family protein [Bacteroidales bacterium]